MNHINLDVIGGFIIATLFWVAVIILHSVANRRK